MSVLQKVFFFCAEYETGDISMEGIFEVIVQIILEVIFELIGEIIGAIVEEFFSQLNFFGSNNNLTEISRSNEIISLNILNK